MARRGLSRARPVFKEVGVKGFMGLLKVGVIGFALIAGGVAAYRYKDRLAGTWKSRKGIESLKGYADRLSVGRLLDSAAFIKNLGGHAHLGAHFVHLR